MKLILDYSRWRCGGSDCGGINRNRLGEGDTSLLNSEGYSCCLGLFAPQLKPDITAEKLLGHGDTSSIEEEIPYLNYYEYETGKFYNTSLSTTAIGVNDDPDNTPEEKIKLLKRLFSKAGHEIEVINKPLSKLV